MERRRQWFDAINNFLPSGTLAYTESKSIVICEDHFSVDCFKSNKLNRLTEVSVPSIYHSVVEELSGIEESIYIETTETATTSPILQASPVEEVTPVLQKLLPIIRFKNSELSTSGYVKTFEKDVVTPDFRRISPALRIPQADVTPRKQNLIRMKRMRKIQQKEIDKLKSALTASKSVIKIANKISAMKAFRQIETSLDPAGIVFLKSRFANAQKTRPKWTWRNKAIALAIYKRGPRCYRFLQTLLKFPSKRTLRTMLKKFSFRTGINKCIMQQLKKQVEKMTIEEKTCALLFDEMAVTPNLTYLQSADEVVGYVDLGSLGRRNILANHALVFMVQGIYKHWKQPVAYYFTHDTISANDLKFLLKEIISALQRVGFIIMCTVCDQGSTNRSAIRQLTKDQLGPYFYVNWQKIVTVFDPPHLLKNTRNALLKYNIIFEDDKVAKFEHIVSAYNLDKKKRFRQLLKLTDKHFQVQRHPKRKLRVSIAAQTLSHSVASAIENFCDRGNLPAEAIYTAEFAEHIDTLFDSINGRAMTPAAGKDYRQILVKDSSHIKFWDEQLTRIQSWKFEDKVTKAIKENLPFKRSWSTSINAIKELWNMCEANGFKYLSPRSLNQDSLENLFGIVHQHGVRNVNPTCLQFIAVLKSSILNGLIAPNNRGFNCQSDDRSILDNMQDFLQCNLGASVTDSGSVRLDTNLDLVLDSFLVEQCDLPASAHLCSEIIQQFTFSCDDCRNSFLSSDMESFHIFTMFKDKFERSPYASEPFMLYVAKVDFVTLHILKQWGFLKHLKQNIHVTVNKIDSSWFTCTIHTDLKRTLLNKIILLFINKHLVGITKHLSKQRKYPHFNVLR
ncbi:hypothetical protein ILUMI_25888 [Ignelater luminosus]|uniref:THAP-type domain-containing protein n=1 Tax=Ignelater luminosus TaxID=2038154 RepID=A0A8K0C7K0_IGNLU|nr:hypothetical protein ILUMI_25888 [Ignelater luminosus]